MNFSKRIRVCVVALLLLLLPCSVGMCSEYRITEEQLNALEIQFQELSENNQRLEILLSESERDLMDSQEQLEILKTELQEVKQIISQLKADSESAKQSLEIANAELQTVCESVKQLDNQRKKAEREKNLWKIISAILGVVAVTR